MAAAVGLAAQVPTGLPVAHQAEHHGASAGATSQASVTHARLASAIRPANGQEQAKQASYTVQSGDTLSAIAGRFYQNPAQWPAIYRANSGKVPSANELQPGEVLSIPANPGQMPSTSAGLSPGTGDAAPQQAPQQSAPAQDAPQAAAPSDSGASASGSYSGGTPGGAFGKCVVAHESGGNAQVTNSSGHYGLYQFSPSTWAAYGGNPSDFGHASVGEQNHVFSNAIAQGGQSNWSSYDGC
jgi:LysM repeat protein